jgi:regulatory protein
LGYRAVDLDGRQLVLPVVALASLGLGPSDPVPPHLRARVEELASIELAYQAALRSLAGRARSRADLRRVLLEHHAATAVDAALERMAARGWLDDGRFATEYAARRARGSRGPERLVRDLVARGVARSVAEAAVQSAVAESGTDPERTAEALARRRAAHLVGLPRAVRKRRLLAFLARRGFRGAPVVALVDAVCQASS